MSLDKSAVAFISASGGLILECNEEFVRLLGLPEKKIIGEELPKFCKFGGFEQLMEASYQLENLRDSWRAPIVTIDEDDTYEVVVHPSPKKIRNSSVHEAEIRLFNPNRRDSLRRASVLAEQKECKESKDEKGSDRVHTVLVVDDSPTALKLMARMISRLGHHVQTATNGVDALDHVARDKYDIVLMDINMPTMNGLQASHEMRRLEQQHGGQHQKIIAMSGDICSTLFTEVSNAGFDAFIPKPLTEESFLEVLHMRCNKK